MAYNALDIAKKIINKTDVERGDSITNLKLQKMLYYMQGFWLAVFDRPLFDEDIEAWMYGPVVPSVYEEYKSYEKRAIDIIEHGTVISLSSEEEEDLFNEVYDVYNQYSATALIDMTHGEMPWATTTVGKGHVIDRNKMRVFFKTKIN